VITPGRRRLSRARAGDDAAEFLSLVERVSAIPAE
jgi:hypothetical protein